MKEDKIKYYLHGAKEISRKEIEEYFNENFDDCYNFSDYNLSKSLIKKLEKVEEKGINPSDYFKENYPNEYFENLIKWIDDVIDS